jgi:hypothetical protein
MAATSDDLRQLTYVQMLGKIFVRSVLIPSAENLITWGGPCPFLVRLAT